MNIEQLYAEYLKRRDVTTDSRKVREGSIFFALKGDNFDGNLFAASALEQGAALCVIDNPECKVDDRCVVVDDVLKTLQELARYHRSQLTVPVIGITGTNGKTTTKELLAAVLSKRYRVHATQGNFNNHIGVPLTLLSMPADAEILIVEMGANHPGEIDFLCNIANPEFGLITNVGKAHLEGFGSFKGVIRTKTELYKHLAAMAGVIFVNSDNEILMERAEKMSQLPSSPSVLPGVIPSIPGTKPSDYTDDFKVRGVNMPMASVVTYGSSETAECKGAFVSADPYMKFYFEDDDNVYTVQSQLIGAYNYDNAMAAVCVGRYFGVELFDIKTATLTNVSVPGSAKVSPDPKSVKDWSTPQKFKVTAEDGSEKNWVVVVSSIKNNATDLQLLFKDQFKVNRSQDTIYIKLKNGSSVGAAAIDSWSVSEGAAVDPKPDAVKAWTDYQSFKVTAEDGSVKTWVLSLSVAAAR